MHLAQDLVPGFLVVEFLVRLVGRLGVEPAAGLEARERVGGRIIRALGLIVRDRHRIRRVAVDALDRVACVDER